MSPKISYKAIMPEQFVNVSEIFDINLSCFSNYLNCFCAFLGEDIIGVLFLIRIDKYTARIKYFQVLPLFRNNKIGSNLLKLSENFVVSVNIKKIIARYNNVENDVEKCHCFFSQNKWVAEKYIHTKYRFKKDQFEKHYISKFFNADNFTSGKKLDFIFYNDLSEEKKTHVKKQSEQMFSNGLLPLNNLESMVQDLSVFAFVDKILIAWSVVDLASYNEVSIRNTYVVNEFRNFGLGMYLWYLIFNKTAENQHFAWIKHISFDFQKDDDRINKLYTLLFGDIVEQSIDYYINEKKLI
ncbi:hypothetical protein FACS189413_10150 [Bacteroidia bacterium]|nr:hypothetical protein FACS189413_10150 [Bacteroidia bacterium]